MAEYWGAHTIAARLGISEVTVWTWANNGKLVAYTRVRKGHKFLWTNDELITLSQLAQYREGRDQRRTRRQQAAALRAAQRVPDLSLGPDLAPRFNPTERSGLESAVDLLTRDSVLTTGIERLSDSGNGHPHLTSGPTPGDVDTRLTAPVEPSSEPLCIGKR